MINYNIYNMYVWVIMQCLNPMVLDLLVHKQLVIGASICDFRFTKNVQTLNGWPPEDLAEWGKNP